MQTLQLILKLLNGYKTYASTIAAVMAALALVLNGDYATGIPAVVTAIKAILVLASGGAVASMRHAIAKAADKQNSR